MKIRGFYRLMAWILSFSMVLQVAGITGYAMESTESFQVDSTENVFVTESYQEEKFGSDMEENESIVMEDSQKSILSFESEYMIYEVLSESEKTVKLSGVNRADFNEYYRSGWASFEAADITIPATVSNGGVTYKVVEIGDFAFADYIYDQEYQVPFHSDEYVGNNLYVKKITVNNGIKKIGNGAFYRMYILEEIVLPDSIEEIGMAAFALDKQRVEYANMSGEGNTVLKVNIPENIKKISDYAYSGVTFQGILKIPESVEVIGESAFGWEGELSNYAAVDVPATVKSIGYNAFCNTSLVMAVLRKTTLPKIESSYAENVYNSLMFGYQIQSNLLVYVPANLVSGYESSGFSSYVRGITFKDIDQYIEEDFSSDPFHFTYQGETVTKLEVRGSDEFSVVMDNEKLGVKDIQWKLKLIKSSCPYLTEAEQCVRVTYAEDGSINIKILCSETTVQLIGKVTGYKDVVLQIHGLYQGQGDMAWIDRLAALTQEEIAPLATVYSQSGTKEQIEEIRAKAEEITAGCTTDREKIFAIEQWVANYVAYDYDYYSKYHEKGISPYEETPVGAYEVFSNRYSVCAGYAVLSEVMVRSIGIPCVYVEGVAGGPHAWNAAYDKENQEWIYFDATWDTAGSLLDSQFTVGDVRDSYFDFDPVQEMTNNGRYTLWMNIDEKEASYDTTFYVNKSFITLFEGQTGQLEFLNEIGDVTFVVEEKYVEEDMDFSLFYENLEREGRFITVDATGKITALKEGQSVIGVRERNAEYNSREIYVRVMPRENMYFGEETYTLIMGENGKLDVFQGKGIWENSTWGRRAITEFVELTSDNPNIVKVDEKGNLVPVSLGVATITGKMCFDDSMENLISCKVVVENPPTVVEEKEQFTQDNLKYEILTKPLGDTPGTVSVIQQSYRNYESSANVTVEIPETVEYEGLTYKVTVIGKNAFSDLVGKATVSIPAGVERIEERAFSSGDQGADLVGELSFPQNSRLTYIGPYAFAENEKLSKVDLSNCTRLEKIDIWAFAECSYFSMDWQGNETSTGIAEVALPENLKVIEQHAFYMCQQLSKVKLPKNMDYIGHYAFASTEIGGVIDFSGVKVIGENIFKESGGWIEGIILNDDRTAIESDLFRGSGASWIASASCLEAIGGVENIQSGDVLLSEKITHIGEQAFFSNYNIRNVRAPGVKTIGEAAFYGCSLLECVQAPKVESIGEKAFGQCTNLVDIDFEQNLKVIPEKAFIKCSKLTEFTLSDELTEIGYGSLYECGVSGNVRIPSEKISYFGQRCFKAGLRFYIPIVVSNEYMKELRDYSVAFYDLNGNVIESNIKGIDALLMEYPQYTVGASYEVIRNAIEVYVEYSDGTIEEIEDFVIEEGIFKAGGQEIEISCYGFTDVIKVGSSPNKQPVWYISPRDPSYTSKVYKTGTSFQQVKDLFIIRAYYEDGTYEEFEEYDVWPGTFAEGENWVTFAFCDFVGGAYKTQSRLFEASGEVEETPDGPIGPEDPDGPQDPDNPNPGPDNPNPDPDNPDPKPEDPKEPVFSGMEVYIKTGSELMMAPKAGYVVTAEDLLVYLQEKTETGNKLWEVTDFNIYNGTLKAGENKIRVVCYDSRGNVFEEELEIDAVARLESIDVKLKKSVKIKAGLAMNPSNFTVIAVYGGVNGYTESKEIKNFEIVGNSVITEGLNILSFSYTESTWAFGTITKTAEWKAYTQDQPVLSVSALNINQYAAETADFEVHMPFGLQVSLDGMFYQNNKGTVQEGISYEISEDGRCVVRVPKLLKNKAYKLYVKAKVEETNNEYYLPIKITLQTVLPKITLSARGLNIFFTDEESRTSEVTIKNPSGVKIQSVAFEENSGMDQYFDITFSQEEQKLSLKLTEGTAAKKEIVSKGKVLFRVENYTQPVTASVNVAISEKQPKLKITPSSVNINTKMFDDKETYFDVTMQDGKNYVSVDLTDTVLEVTAGGEFLERVVPNGNRVTLNIKNTVDFNKGKNIKMNLQAANWKKPIGVTYKVKTVSVLPKAVLETKSLNLDLRAVGAEAVTMLKFDTKQGEITYKALPATLTAVKNNETAPVVSLQKLDEVTYKVKVTAPSGVVKGTYKYDITPELSNGTALKKVTLTVKVTTSNKPVGATMKALKGGKIELINREATKYEYTVQPTVKGTFIKEISLLRVEFGNEFKDLSLFNVKVNKEEGAVSTVEISASEASNIVSGKKYKLTFAVTPATISQNLEPSQVSVTLVPKESKLQLIANIKSAILYRNFSTWEVKYSVTPKMDGVKIQTMEYVPDSKVPEGAFDVTKTETGVYKIRIADKTKVVSGKTYKLSFKVVAKGGTKAVTQSLSVKVQ